MWIRGLYRTDLLWGAIWVHIIPPHCPYPLPHLWNPRTILYFYCIRYTYMCTRIVRSNNLRRADVLYLHLFHSEQCGGVGFPGPFCCQEGLTCYVSNEYFHECYYSDGVWSPLLCRGKWLAHYITEPADTDSWDSRFWPFIIKQAFNDCCFGIRIIFSNMLWRFSWLFRDLHARNFVGRAGRRRMLLLLYWFPSGKVWPRSVNFTL